MLRHDLVLKYNELYLVGEETVASIREYATGLYLRDTRFLDCWELQLNGEPLEPLDARVRGPDRAVIVAANSALPADERGIDEPVLPLTIAVEQHLRLDAGLRVHIVLRNYNDRVLPLIVTLEIGADFRDLFDIRGFQRLARDGRYLPITRASDGLRFGFADRSGETAELITAFNPAPARIMVSPHPEDVEREPAPVLPSFDQLSEPPLLPPPPRGTAFFLVTLEPGDPWDLDVTLTPVPAGARPIPAAATEQRAGHVRDVAHIETDHHWVNRILDRAADDLAMLETSFREGRLTAAGIPWFVAPFGRDSAIVALQTLYLAPGRAQQTLRTLAALQGSKVDPFREEEPGKILHEMRYGEMTRLGEVPHAPYYGSVDATPLFVMLFAETVRWTADEILYRELLPNVQRALNWIEQWGDCDGDGFVEYTMQPTAAGRIVHQGWKDSHDSLHDPDGQEVSGPIALVEVQGYVYAAFRWLSESAARFGDADWASELREWADAIRRLVEERFWLPEEGYYAQALDGDKRPVAAIASNAGHLLFCGLPSPERGRLVAARLRRSDLDSGWGVRTLATSMATYNPMSYHNGSVWPHDNSLIAAGLGRYGERDGLERIASALFRAAEHLPEHRLPELYCGFPHNEDAAADVPVQYPVSCSPQAWAAGAGLLLIRAMLGLAADPGSATLRVAPALPHWLSRVRIDGLQALGQRFDLEVARDATGYRVQSDGPVEVVPPN